MKFPALLFLLLLISCAIMPAGSAYPSRRATTSESREFQELMARDKTDKKQVNAEVLTYLLNDTDPRDPQTAAVIENASGCNLILRLVGISNGKIYNLPVPARAKNQFVVQKGSYTLRSEICGAKYYSQKVLNDPLILKLNAQ